MSLLATRLAKVLDPIMLRVAAPTRMAELRVIRIDISVKKEKLRQALASTASREIGKKSERSAPPEAASGRRG